MRGDFNRLRASMEFATQKMGARGDRVLYVMHGVSIGEFVYGCGYAYSSEEDVCLVFKFKRRVPFAQMPKSR